LEEIQKIESLDPARKIKLLKIKEIENTFFGIFFAMYKALNYYKNNKRRMNHKINKKKIGMEVGANNNHSL